MPETTLGEVLKKAIELEERGYAFYKKCAQNTGSADGKAMFEYLGGQELTHIDQIKRLAQDVTVDKKITVQVPQPKKIEFDIFKKRVRGGTADEKTDALAALNIGIEAEKGSIELYQRLDGQCGKGACTGVFRRIGQEEEKHLAILENEVEFVTETGDYHDFKVVTF